MIHTLLIVDDEKEIRKGLFEFAWSGVGFKAVAALEDGGQALEYILKYPVDVVLCDILMPKMDGIELARKVNELKIPVKLVFLTGHKDMEYIRAAMRYGCKDYLLKPTRFSQLQEVFCDLKQQLDEEWKMGFTPGETLDPEQSNQLVLMACRYMKDHLATVSLESVAGFLRISPSYLSKIFKDHTGINFSDFHQRERMREAGELLKDPRNQINEIARLVGYSNSANFARAFKLQFSVSPREYRSQANHK